MANTTKWTPLPNEDDGLHAWADNSGRFPIDALLRTHGYIIWRRLKGRDPVWLKNGIEYTQTEILCRLDQNDVADAVYMEDLVKQACEDGLQAA